VARGVHDGAAGTYEDEQKRPEELGEEPAPLLLGIVECPSTGIFEREQRPSPNGSVRHGCLTVDHLVTIAVTALTHIVRTG
jgi:hypothetical protein